MTPRTIAHEASLSMEFSRQEYWSCHFLLWGNLPDPGIESASLVSPALADRFFTNCATWEARIATSFSAKFQEPIETTMQRNPRKANHQVYNKNFHKDFLSIITPEGKSGEKQDVISIHISLYRQSLRNVSVTFIYQWCSANNQTLYYWLVKEKNHLKTLSI